MNRVRRRRGLAAALFSLLLWPLVACTSTTEQDAIQELCVDSEYCHDLQQLVFLLDDCKDAAQTSCSAEVEAVAQLRDKLAKDAKGVSDLLTAKLDELQTRIDEYAAAKCHDTDALPADCAQPISWIVNAANQLLTTLHG